MRCLLLAKAIMGQHSFLSLMHLMLTMTLNPYRRLRISPKDVHNIFFSRIVH